jgi:hypothetical protein
MEIVSAIRVVIFRAGIAVVGNSGIELVFVTVALGMALLLKVDDFNSRGWLRGDLTIGWY